MYPCTSCVSRYATIVHRHPISVAGTVTERHAGANIGDATGNKIEKAGMNGTANRLLESRHCRPTSAGFTEIDILACRKYNIRSSPKDTATSRRHQRHGAITNSSGNSSKTGAKIAAVIAASQGDAVCEIICFVIPVQAGKRSKAEFRGTAIQ